MQRQVYGLTQRQQADKKIDRQADRKEGRQISTQETEKQVNSGHQQTGRQAERYKFEETAEIRR